MTGLETAVKLYQKDKTNENFRTIIKMCMEIFEIWYRHTQRFVRMDRQQLLSEFQMLLYRAANKYDPTCATKWNGFECYLKSAAKKLGISLRRQNKQRLEALPDHYDAPDPKSNYDSNLFDTLDSIKKCLNREEQKLVVFKAMGNTMENIISKMHITEFRYKETMKNIRENKSLRKSLIQV